MKRPKYWLSYAFNSSLGMYIAIASTKHPVLGDIETNVVGSSFESSEEGCKNWFDQFVLQRPDKSDSSDHPQQSRPDS